MEASDKFKLFLQQLVREIEARGGRVRVEGSAKRGAWRLGSDLDLFVYGRRFSRREKAEVYGLLAKLDRIYELRLEERCAHPPVFFVDNGAKARLVEKLLRRDSPARRAARRVLGRLVPKMKHSFAILRLLA